VLVLLPPSETKLDGGDGPPLDIERLGFPELATTREELLDELVTLAGDPAASRSALGLTEAQTTEVSRNADLWTSPTAEALRRYTGVLYDALDPGSLRGAARPRAEHRLVVCSALFGLVRAADPIPAYRLSAGSGLPGGGPAGRWRPILEPLLAQTAELIVDLRSGSYAALGRAPGAITVRVLTEHHTVISHHNKSHKGRLARLLATTRAEPSDVDGVLRVLRRAGLHVEHGSPNMLDVLVAHP
jgi:uncharacterized protein